MFDPSHIVIPFPGMSSLPIPEREALYRQLAERFGRRVIVGLLEGRRPEYISHFARLAGSYARMALEVRVDTTRQQTYVDNFRFGLNAVRHAFGVGRN